MVSIAGSINCEVEAEAKAWPWVTDTVAIHVVVRTCYMKQEAAVESLAAAAAEWSTAAAKTDPDVPASEQ
jgi:hypothetical protein